MWAWRRILATVLATLGLCLALGAGAAKPQEGIDFQRINPPLAADKDKIEVVEFFWYGCPHCFDFEPILDGWLKKLPADVRFRRVPAIFANPKWPPAARLYYTLEAMNLVDKLHGGVFDAIHVDRQRLFDEKVVFDWVAKKGVDAKKFREVWSSAGVQDRMRHAGELTRAAGALAVPSVMVDGRYLVPGMGDYVELLAITELLIARVRAERLAGVGRK